VPRSSPKYALLNEITLKSNKFLLKNYGLIIFYEDEKKKRKMAKSGGFPFPISHFSNDTKKIIMKKINSFQLGFITIKIVFSFYPL
jgi:hypothetical protein